MSSPEKSKSDPVSAALSRVAKAVAPVEKAGNIANRTVKEDDDILSGLLDAILAAKLDDDEEDDSFGEVADGRWRFVLHGLGILDSVRAAVSDPAVSEKDKLISVKQQQQVSSLLQLVVALGLVPNLAPGVGLPAERRSAFFRCLKSAGSEDKDVDVEEKYDRLVKVTTGVLSFVGEKQLGGVFLNKHLGDLLASLIQLGHAPLKKPQEDGKERSPSSSSFVMTQEKYDRFCKEQEYFRRQLTALMDRVYQPLVVKYLLVIQGGGTKDKKPRWLVSTCGELLTGRLIRKGGVRSVIRGVMDMGGEGVPQAQKRQMVAAVLAAPPKTGGYRDAEEYYSAVCPQILTLVASAACVDGTGADEESREMGATACECVKSVSERSLVHSRRHLFAPAMAPLLALTTEVDGEDHVTVTEAEISDCVRLLHYIFVSGTEPSGPFSSHLEPCLLVLMELHCSVTFGASHLRKPVREILERYLRTSCNSDAVAAVRHFCFRGAVLPPEKDSQQQQPQQTRMRLMRPDLKFAVGEEGGVSLRQSDEAEESFYVADDEKSIAVVDLLESCGGLNGKQVSLDLFMSLLRDLSSMMARKGGGRWASPEKEEEPEVLLAEANTSSAKNLEQKLLDFGEELDRTMLELRRQLMVIRLLGLLSEDVQLQERLVKDSGQLMEFVGLTLQRAAIGCARAAAPADPREERDADEGPGSLEVQSVTMALTLLSLKLTQDDGIGTEDWDRMKSLLPDLTALAGSYPEERARSLARRMSGLIRTHGIVEDSQAEVRDRCGKVMSGVEKVRDLAEQMKRMRAQLEEDDGAPDPASMVRYRAALFQLSDPLLPVRGHALIELTNLVEAKDEETMKNIGKVISIFRENLEDEDTYIYLQCVAGLAACADRDPDLVVDVLTREFAAVEDRVKDPEKAMEVRTKLGEALVKVTRLLGEMTPAFRDRLVNPFLSQLAHPDSLVRASCLSNLGEVCKNIKFSLDGILPEILLSLQQTLDLDPAIEVRRAAVLVVALLLRGLGRDALRTTPNCAELLRDVWRVLARLRRSETDEALLAHVAAALEEVDAVVRDLFRTDAGRPEKTIYVLDAPPKDPF